MTQTMKQQRCAVQAYDAARLAAEVGKRRNWAIISHPDAGKTTLTEKLLLYGGAIQEAGDVKARRSARHATSDVRSRTLHTNPGFPSALSQQTGSPGVKIFGSDTVLGAARHVRCALCALSSNFFAPLLLAPRGYTAS